MSNLQPVLGLALLLLAAPLAASQVYRWTDDAGDFHYTDRPRQPNAEAVEVDPIGPADGGAHHRDRTRQRQRLLDALERERSKESFRKAYAAKQAATRTANCTRARDTLRSLMESPLVYRLNDAGERVYLSDNRRDRETAQARGAVARWCD